MKTVLVTGASSGIGKSIAQTLDQSGFRVVLVARNLEKLNSTAETLNNSPLCEPCDLNSASSIRDLASRLSDLDTPLCGLVNNAGIYLANNLSETTDDEWNMMYQLNLLGPAQLTQACLPLLKKSQQPHKFIINISSTAAHRPVEGSGAYGALKAAFTYMTKVQALELASESIKVNIVSPGIIDTPLHSFDKNDKENMDFINNLQPLGQIGKPTDIASIVKFLSEESNNWITGSDFVIDGGITLK